MIEVTCAVLGPLAENAYLVADREAASGVIVDPGSDPGPLLFKAKGLRIVAILLTHAHFDHVAGLPAVKEATGAPIAIHRAEGSWLTDPRLNRSQLRTALAGRIVDGPGPDVLFDDGASFRFADHLVQAWHLPGHSPGHAAFLVGGHAFTGDLIFEQAPGRSDLPGGDPRAMEASLKRLLGLPHGTMIHPGHGRSFSYGGSLTPSSLEGGSR